MPEDKVKRNKRITKWQSDNKDRIVLLVDKETGQRIRSAAERAGLSITAFIVKALEEN